MLKRTDVESIPILGVGPIVIGQVCEFDYFGAQAHKALHEEGYRVILTNSSPVTIVTDPAMADVTYIEPIKWATMARIIERERPDTLLPIMDGQTVLNRALDLECHGVLEKFGAETTGTNVDTTDKAEDHSRFGKAMRDIGPVCPYSGIAHSMEEAYGVLEQVGFLCVIRPSLTMDGTGDGIAYNREEFEEIRACGLDLPPTNELLTSESLIGWKEYEMEMVRDEKDNCIIIYSIENLDPMGVYTDGSTTAAPVQTLTNKEYQIIHNASLMVLREIGVETGGPNVQFGICPNTGRMVVIEMNPRISRSLALAFRVTGFPIAKIAAKLTAGYTFGELQNNTIGGRTPTSFEPAVDHVMIKILYFALEKFPRADARLTTQMKSIGEVMAIGRTFQEPVQKALRSLEVGATGLDLKLNLDNPEADSILKRELTVPSAECIWYVADTFRAGKSAEKVFGPTHVGEWLLVQIEDLVKDEEKVKTLGLSSINRELMHELKCRGFFDTCPVKLLGVTEKNPRGHRHKLKVLSVYRCVDTHTAEFAANATYMYPTYEEEYEANPSGREKIMTLGGGPNRIGQGIELDYCRMHAVLAICENDYGTIMVNYDSKTVPTDYDTSDRLYSEPVILEDVLEIIRIEQPKGVTIQYGGQTPLKLYRVLEEADVPITGTSSDVIDRAGDRECFRQMVQHLNLRQSANTTTRSEDEALVTSKAVGYPLVVRPSYMLGERAMEIVYQEEELKRYMHEVVQISNDSSALLSHFLSCAIEIDIDAVCGGEIVVIGVIMQYIEQAGVYFGDPACPLPPYSLPRHIQDEICEQVKKMTPELGVAGLVSVQMAVQSEDVFAIEVNLYASRIVPFVSECVGESLAKVAAHVMTDKTLAEVGFIQETIPPLFSVKEAVFPFAKFPGVDPIPGPGVKSTGEVMDVGDSLAGASAKAQLGAGEALPTVSCVFVSVHEDDRPFVAQAAGDLVALGFEAVAAADTTRVIEIAGPPVRCVNKVTEGRLHVMDMTRNDEATLITNTTGGWQSIAGSYSIRRNALQHKIHCTTTIVGGQAICEAPEFGPEKAVRRLQDLHVGIKVWVNSP